MNARTGVLCNRNSISSLCHLSHTYPLTHTHTSATERYADMTKTLFLSLFWAGLYPQGMFITSLTFLISYGLDKYRYAHALLVIFL